MRIQIDTCVLSSTSTNFLIFFSSNLNLNVCVNLAKIAINWLRANACLFNLTIANDITMADDMKTEAREREWEENIYWIFRSDI